MTKTELIEETKRLIDGLPEDPTWDDLMHAIDVRQTIDEGLAGSRAGGVRIPVSGEDGLRPGMNLDDMSSVVDRMEGR